MKYVIRADGRKQSPSRAMHDEWVARRAKYGALTPSLGDWLDTPRARDLPVVIHFKEGPAGVRDLEDALMSDDAYQVDRARDEVRARHRTAGAALEAAVRELGGTDVLLPGLTPSLYATLSPEALKKIARHPDVEGIFRNKQGKIHRLSAPNSVTFPHIDSGFNALGYFGSGFKIGLVEGPCAVWKHHESLSNLSGYTTSQVAASCDAGAQCASVCGAEADEGSGFCKDQTGGGDLHCIDKHESEIASTIAASRGGAEWGAAEIHLYQYNTPDTGTDVACEATAMDNAFGWFTDSSRSVHTVTESWACDLTDDDVGSGYADDKDGYYEDYFSRNAPHVLTVRAAGNGANYGDFAVGCEPSNALCVGGMQFAAPDGGAISVALESSINLPSGPVDLAKDREDPDIVAFAALSGSGVDVMDVSGGTTAWTTDSGTSFAAPVMASMAALLKSECGGNIDEKYVRAIMMTAASYYNPNGDATYSTSDTCSNDLMYDPVDDCLDGAGSPVAEDVMQWCGSPVTGLTASGGTTTLDTNNCDGPCGTAATEAMDESGEKSDVLSSSGDGGIVSSSGDGGVSTDGTGATNWYYTVILSVTLAHNDRIRATVAWDTCTNGSVHPSIIGNDIDLWLCPTSGADCVAWSRSFDNNWEGLDWTKTTTGSATYELRVGYDASYEYEASGRLGCPDDATDEPLSYAYVYGAASSFAQYVP
jgi:hypothetical protein